MKSSELYDIATKYKTPSFVFDAEAVQTRVHEIKTIIGDDINLCFSVKANPFFIPVLNDDLYHFEVCSPGELVICEQDKIPGKKIIYSGVNKGEKDIREAMEYGVETFTAESIRQVEMIHKEAERKNKTVPLLLRLNSGNQFGMSEEDLLRTIENREQYKNVKIMGIHFFAGTQRRKLEEKKKELHNLVELIIYIEKTYRYQIRNLQYGPGLPVPLFEGDDFSDTLKPLKEIVPFLKEGREKVKVTIEMGRFIAAECGCYLTKVADQKVNQGSNYCILDGGMNHVNYYGQIMGMKVPIIENLSLKYREHREKSEKSKTWCLCGSLCTSADILVRQIELKDLNLGDIMAFYNIGAYSVTEGIYLFLSRTMPRVILREKEGKTKLLRDFFETSTINRQSEKETVKNGTND